MEFFESRAFSSSISALHRQKRSNGKYSARGLIFPCFVQHEVCPEIKKERTRRVSLKKKAEVF